MISVELILISNIIAKKSKIVQAHLLWDQKKLFEDDPAVKNLRSLSLYPANMYRDLERVKNRPKKVY